MVTRSVKEVQVEIKPVIPTQPQVVALIEKLNRYQIGLYGVEPCTLEAPEVLVKNNAFMVGAYVGEVLVGIGAVKLLEGYAEIKRMYVEEGFRGRAVAEKIMQALERHAKENGITKILLETGNLHHAAMKFYQKMGYQEVGSFGDYTANGISVFFGKHLNQV